MSSRGVWLGAAAIFCAFVATCLIGSGLITRGRAFPDPSCDALDSTRKTLAQVIGGAAIIFTFAWTFLKDSETLEQARQQNANQQYIAAAQLLSASQSVATRSAALFSLGRIAATREEYAMPVRDAVVALIVQSSLEPWKHITDLAPAGSTAERTGIFRIEQDIQAAIQVLGSRSLGADDPTRDMVLDKAYLVGGNFSNRDGFKGAWLQAAVLTGTDFRRADLRDTHFDGSQFSDWAGYGAMS